MAYQCGICGTSIEKIFGYCSRACKQVYEHERREGILKMLPWEITVEAYKFKDKGYSQLHNVLLEIVQEPDNWIKQHRLIRIIRYCRIKKIPTEKLETTYHLLKQADAPHYNQKAGQIWSREFLLQPDLEIDIDFLPLSVLEHF